MLLRQPARLLVAGLLSILAVLPAVAAPPEIIDINDVFVDDFLSEACGFPVQVNVTGQLITRARDGTQDTTAANYQTTFTNLESGMSFTARTSGLERISSTDTTVTYSFSGGSKAVIPGRGAVYINVGRFVETVTFDPKTGDVIDVDTVREGRADENGIEIGCALLAGESLP